MSRDQEVMNTILAKMYAVLNAGDTVNPDAPISSDSSFVSFMSPGIAFDPSELNFGFSTTTDEVERASTFAELVDIVPTTNGFWSDSGTRLSQMYKKVLDQAIVADSKLTEAEQAKLENAYKILWTKSMVPNLDGGMDEVMNETPFYERISSLRQIYEANLMAFNNRLINTIKNKNDPATVADWNINAPIYKAQVTAAYQKYIAAGANNIEAAVNLIDQLSGRDPKRIFGEARMRMNTLKRMDLNMQEYYFTKYIPTQFWSNANWPKFTMNSNELHTVETSNSTSWGGGGGIGFGLWSFGAGAQYSSSTTRFNSDASNFSLEVEITRIPIRRSWFSGGLLSSKSWKADFQLSDGGLPPKGELPLYATEIIFAKNLKISMDMTSTSDYSASTSFSTSGRVGWGPFSLRGNYSSSSSKKSHDFSFSGGSLICPGLQIIGMVCRTLPKSPNPLPGTIFS